MRVIEIVGAAAAVLLAVAAGLGLKKHAEKQLPQSREDRAVVHLVQALGHDPAKVLVRLVRGAGARQGLQVYTKTGKPVRFYTLKELKRATRDQKTRAAFAAARAG